jgi:hypothetical protein
MGSLLAIPATSNLSMLGLETQPAMILAHALQDYGAYTVDDAAWSVYGLVTETSPSGNTGNEFQSKWGFPMDPASKDVPWARDMDRLFKAVSVVDNWNAALWQTVSVSNGLLGAGGGLPRMPWAPSFNGTAPPPPRKGRSTSGGKAFAAAPSSCSGTTW